MSVQEVSKKGSQTLDKSAKAIVAAADNAAKVLQDVNASIVTQSKALADLVQETEYAAENKAKIEAETADKARDAKIELEFKVRENETGTLNALLKKNGLVGVTKAELDRLGQERDQAVQDAQRTEYEAVVAKEKELKSQFALEKLTAENAHNQQLAVLRAENEQHVKTQQLLEGQLSELKHQISQNREAEIKRAEALAKASGATVNVSKQ